MESFETVKEMIDNLRSEDTDLRLSSMQGIHLIAATLGPERTRDELLLYLTDYLDDNDEVLRVFANALGTMLQEVGGVTYATSLFGPLETLSGLDEITVRDDAVASLQNIGESIFRGPYCSDSAAAKAQGEFMSLVKRLATGTPQCRSSSCFLLATVYKEASASVQATLLATFKLLCGDGEIMVRRAACVALAKNLAAVLNPKGMVEAVKSLTEFAKDTCDGVRLQAIPTAAILLKLLPETQHAPILTAVRTISSDNSWRVRYMAADSLGTLAAALSPPDVVRYIVPIFRALCQDAEAEIRAAAVYNMANVLAVCRDSDGKKDVLVSGTRLIAAGSAHVRMSLASALLRSVAHVPRDLWGSTIVPACTALLTDEEADVRLSLVSGFSSMGNTIEAKELAPQLVPVVIALSTDSKWRLREVVVSQVPYVITALGRGSADKVLEVCVECVTDRVATIREAAVQSCCKLVAENGSSWTVRNLITRLEPLAADRNYLHRVTLCRFFIALAGVADFDGSACMSSVWPLLVKLSDDSVPNVRLNVAKALLALQKAEKISARVAEPVLSKLKKDPSEDVQDVASHRVVPPVKSR